MTGMINLADCAKNKTMSLASMDKFKCHKEVHALPMTRGAYSNLLAWDYGEQVDEGNDHDEDGYLVVYGRGTDDEYFSWSPKRAFDEGYTKI